ncbi:MAG: carbon storage regulator [Thermoguttaceae bacterium]|nr:carbon storage regulator [Thermoguttaceae bacterium]
MLVLSRKKGESVVIDGKIRIVVVDVRGDKARIGIEAPADVAVYRSEVLAKKEAAEAKNSSDETNARDAEPTPDETVETLCLSKMLALFYRDVASERNVERDKDEDLGETGDLEKAETSEEKRNAARTTLREIVKNVKTKKV